MRLFIALQFSPCTPNYQFEFGESIYPFDFDLKQFYDYIGGYRYEKGPQGKLSDLVGR